MTPPLDVGTDIRLFVISHNITQSLKVPIYFVNITTLSEYRKDAHTSVYTIRQGKMLTPKQQADPIIYARLYSLMSPWFARHMERIYIHTRIISRV